MQKEAQQQIQQYAKTILPTFSKQLQHLINIRSESQDPAQRKNLPKILQEMGKLLKLMNIRYTIVPNHGYPALIATIPSNKSSKTITLYNHLDVQPVDAKDWQLKKHHMKTPFDAKETNGIIHGRGATDDKGPALTALHAINALRKMNLSHPKIQLIYETEEESGSGHFATLLNENKKHLIKPNAILVTDTIFEGDHPSITCSLRGLAKTEISVPLQTKNQNNHKNDFEVIDITGGDQRPEGIATKIPPKASMFIKINKNQDAFIRYTKETYPYITITKNKNYLTLTSTVGKKDIHSGVFGGIVRNPLTILSSITGSYATNQLNISIKNQTPLTQLCSLIAQTIDFQTGNVSIPHFYDATPTITPHHHAHLTATSKAVDLFHDLQQEGIDLKQIYTTSGVDARIRAWHKPTFEIHGFVIDKKTNTARLKVTARLVGKQNPQHVLNNIEKHVHRLLKSTHCTHHTGTPAITTPIENIYVKFAATACTKGFGKKTLFVGGGGTIGSMPPFAHTFPKVPIVLLALSKMSDGYHAPDECYELAQAHKGIVVIAEYLHEVSKIN